VNEVNLQPLPVGEVVPVQIPLIESSTNGQFPSHYPRSARGHATLHWGRGRPAALEVPVIPPR
jgi:predicted acyl esterase